MTTPPPDRPAEGSGAASRAGVRLATGMGMGHFPVWPGTVGSLFSVLLFALAYSTLEGAVLRFAYLVVLLAVVLLAFWSTEHALQHWKTEDPQVVVIDEVAGQWLTYGALVLPRVDVPGADGWKYLLAGFILFRALDTLKPFPVRRSERLDGAAGVVVDDLLAGIYAGLGLLLLAWMKWL